MVVYNKIEDEWLKGKFSFTNQHGATEVTLITKNQIYELPFFIFEDAYFTLKKVSEDKERNYLFGDNLIQRGNAGQAVIRPLLNSYGVPTKKLPSMSPDSFFTDTEYELNCQHISDALSKIPLDKPCVVHPNIGLGLAQMDTKAPKTYIYLMSRLRANEQH